MQKLGWLQTTVALAGRTCREAVGRVPSARPALTERERDLSRSPATATPLAVAVVEGDVEAVEWLIQLYDAKGVAWRDQDPERALSRLAAGRGAIEPLKRLRAEGYAWDAWTSHDAAEGGHLETLKWLRANGCPWDARTCYYAAKGGHLEVLQWLHQDGCPWDEDACYAAAMEGRLEVLRWLRENECPWDETTCWAAAERGHLEVLRWAHENGCEWDEETRVRGAEQPRGRAVVRASERVPVGRDACATAAKGGTWSCFGGRARTGASGTNRRARRRRREATWRC